MTAIEVQAFGTYDLYTVCVMVTDENRDVKAITKAYCDLRGLPSTEGLPDNMLRDATDDFIKYLRKEGFRELKTTAVYFSD